jgi:biotin carboxyl carrier protein
MPKDTPIPTPPIEFWGMLRMKIIQTSGFLIVCLGIAWSWHEMARPLTFPGEVEVTQANIVATEAGVLTNLLITPFQQVKTGDPIADLNVANAHALAIRIEAMRRTLDRLALETKTGTDSNIATLREVIYREQDKIQALETTPSHLIAPINGSVTAIYHHPGDHVLPGQVIATITAKKAHRIVGFISPAFPIPPKAGMQVKVRAKSGNNKQASATILAVGPQLEPITNILAYSVTTRMIATQPVGQPISIGLPAGIDFLPGEPLEIKLIP